MQGTSSHLRKVGFQAHKNTQRIIFRWQKFLENYSLNFIKRESFHIEIIFKKFSPWLLQYCLPCSNVRRSPRFSEKNISIISNFTLGYFCYTTSGYDGCDKYQVWKTPHDIKVESCHLVINGASTEMIPRPKERFVYKRCHEGKFSWRKDLWVLSLLKYLSPQLFKDCFFKVLKTIGKQNEKGTIF